MPRITAHVAALTGIALLTVACSVGDKDPLSRILRDPIVADGRVFELTAYPFDLLSDPDRYILCQAPCDAEQAARVITVVEPEVRGRFDGYRGATPVRLRVRFNAGCYRQGAVCLHFRTVVLVEEGGREGSNH